MLFTQRMPPRVELDSHPRRTLLWACFQPCGDKATVTSVTWVTVCSGLEPDLMLFCGSLPLHRLFPCWGLSVCFP